MALLRGRRPLPTGRADADPDRVQVERTLRELEREWREYRPRVDPVLEEVRRVERAMEERHGRQR